jgi:dTDP-4-dehydrorhamnose reductase
MQAMKLLITGLNGTLAPVLARAAQSRGLQVLAWPRDRVGPDDAAAGAAFLARERPDAVAHLAMGSADWAARLAQHAAEHALPFVFTSTAMVFHHQPDGPHAITDPCNAQDDYGRYKRQCEEAVQSAHPQAAVVRLGWQIDPSQAGNNMLTALDGWQATRGEVAASRLWRPACSFMADTAQALLALLQRGEGGVHHVDSNADEGHDFHSLVRALQQTFGRHAWQVRADDAYVHDQRLQGGGALVPPLSARLPMRARA